jgi:hypothetical protein
LFIPEFCGHKLSILSLNDESVVAQYLKLSVIIPAIFDIKINISISHNGNVLFIDELDISV